MSRPPIKAIEQIRNYCEKTQCRRCVYGYKDHTISDDIDFIACQLQANNPCDWGMPEKEQTNE